jgi:hypothetical protein
MEYVYNKYIMYIKYTLIHIHTHNSYPFVLGPVATREVRQKHAIVSSITSCSSVNAMTCCSSESCPDLVRGEVRQRHTGAQVIELILRQPTSNHPLNLNNLFIFPVNASFPSPPGS